MKLLCVIVSAVGGVILAQEVLPHTAFLALAIILGVGGLVGLLAKWEADRSVRRRR